MATVGGRKLSWKEASDMLCLSRPTIQKLARERLKTLTPGKGRRERKAILETKGVNFSLGGFDLWMARRGHRYVVKVF